ncbi:hypothetical protein ACQI4E_30765 [Streptomyces sp. CA-252508]|uniref:hypothetical protein n=1 Tax=Streptomyces sp. CA-252508 TaxID=3418946 RepID=UPI003D910ED9
MTTTRRPLGPGPRLDPAPNDDPDRRGRTVAEPAAELATAPDERAPRQEPATRRRLGPGPRTGAPGGPPGADG